MNDNIKYLKAMLKMKWIGMNSVNAINAGLEALKKQEPMEVVSMESFGLGELYTCPACGFVFSKYNSHFCHSCGQKLSWN